MKKIICLILCMIVVISSITGCSNKNLSPTFDQGKIAPKVLEANTRFAFDIFKELNKDESKKNIFISPLSISTALTMTYQGAKNTTKEAMSKTLNYEEINTKTLNETYKNLLRYLEQVDNKIELNINNSIWVRKGEKIKEEFSAVNKEVFDAYITEIDFTQEDAASQINKWINKSTNGKIQKMIEPPISPQVIMYLINAIYFKGEWAEQFDKKNTFKTKFYTAQGKTKDIMMMSKKGEVEYIKRENYQAVRLPYGNGKTSMYCILPNKGVFIDKFIEDMNIDKWKIIKESMVKNQDIIVQIPRFKLEYGIKNLNKSLKDLGMGEAFSNTADFSGIREDIFISRVLHKAVIEVDEKGSEAAGVTVIEMKEAAVKKPITFIANRPFIFIIAEDETDTILFIGKLSDINL